MSFGRSVRARIVAGEISLALGATACAGLTAPTHVPPGEGHEVVFVRGPPTLTIRQITIDGHVACGPDSDGARACGESFTTRVTTGRHYLQVQVQRAGEGGHKDAEERITFEKDARCTIGERFVKTSSSAIDTSGYTEPMLDCQTAPTQGMPDP